MTATVAGIHLGIDTHANRPAANTVPDGSIYSCSTHSLIYKSNFAGNSWATWATLGTFSDPMTTRGDIIIRNASNVTARLGIGSNGKVLTSDGTDISWQTPTGGASNLQASRVTRTAGDLTTTSTSFVDVTGASITFTTGARRVLLTFVAAYTNSATNHGGFDFDIDGTRAMSASTFGSQIVRNPAAGDYVPVSIAYLTDALSAASHTFKAQWKVGGGTGTLAASTGLSGYTFTATEVYAA